MQESMQDTGTIIVDYTDPPGIVSKTYNFQQRADIIMQGVPINMGIQ